MNLWKLFNSIQTEEMCYKFITENLNLIDVRMNCVKCDKPVAVYNNGNSYSFRCFNRKNHDSSKEWKQSVFHNTLFDKSNLSLRQHVIMIYCFSSDLSFEQISNECSIQQNNNVSSATVASYISIYREAMHYGLFDKQLRTKLGGEDATIEIDETLIGHRKFNRGREVHGKWLLGMIERKTGNVRFAMCPDNKRDKETLLQLIEENVEKKTTIITDMWKGYSNIEAEGFRHKTVNHSYNFINPEDGAHTQTIEATWSALKYKLRLKTDKLNLDSYLFEYMYRKYCKFHDIDIFTELVSDIKKMYSNEIFP